MMTPQEDSTVDLLQQIADLRIQQAQVQQIIEKKTAMLQKLGPLYDKGLKQLEQALKTKQEIDILIGCAEHLIIRVEAKLEHSPRDR
jgi:hypothetical protein